MITDRRLESVPPSGRLAAEHPPLLLHNLLLDFGELRMLVVAEARRRSWLNAYLLAAGIDQIVEDSLHPDPLASGKVAKHLPRLLGLRLGALTARAAIILSSTLWRIGGLRPARRRLLRWQVDWADLVRRLAEMAIADAPSEAMAETLALEVEARVHDGSAGAATGFTENLCRQILRLPSCFRSFDQQPADLEYFAEAIAQRRPSRATPLLIAGIRTSGSYLAPLLAAYLKQRGYSDVRVFSWRPGQRLFPAERRLLRTARSSATLALLIDDPPKTGASLVDAAKALERLGFPRASILPLVQLFGPSESAPQTLAPYRPLLVPWEQWHIQSQLEPEAVRHSLSALLWPSFDVLDVRRMALPEPFDRRGHVSARYRVALSGRESGLREEREILVQGVGCGYFGEHTLAVARALRSYLPAIYGVRDGLMYREWLPEEDKLTAIAPDAAQRIAGVAVNYVLERQRRLAIAGDLSERLKGRDTAVQRAVNLLSLAFGRGALPVRPLLQAPVERLLLAQSPCVIDHNMALSRWFQTPAEAQFVRKVDAAERAFSHRDLFCYDPVYDLAEMAAGCETDGLPQRLRMLYQQAIGRPVTDERWLLYQLVALQERQLSCREEVPEAAYAMSRALQRYFSTLFFADVVLPAEGPLCAIDVDGVLESGYLNVSAPTPASCLALRALLCHGYRPLLATGRSVEEVRERCEAYHLAGGVAEYGALIYEHESGQTADLLDTAARKDLGRLRQVLSAVGGVRLDARYQSAVRAYRLDGGSQRHRLDSETIVNALAASGTAGRVRPVPGRSQTDFVPVTVDKGAGLRALIEAMPRTNGTDTTKPLALAAGDTVADLPMLKLARLACAPASADDLVRRAGVRLMQHPRQGGLADAVALLIGHRPGGCPLCRPAPFSAEAAFVCGVLAAQETGKASRLLLALRLRRALPARA